MEFLGLGLNSEQISKGTEGWPCQNPCEDKNSCQLLPTYMVYIFPKIIARLTDWNCQGTDYHPN